MTRTVQSLQRLMCGLRGHDSVLRYERYRLSLRCLSCGHETAGWVLESERRHLARLAGDVPHRPTNVLERLHGIFAARAGV